MNSNLVELQPGAAAAGGVEAVEAAVLEVSSRISSLNAGKRRLYTRLDELRSGDISLRRRRPRTPLPAPLRPVTFYWIEEASPSVAGGQLRAAGGARR